MGLRKKSEKAEVFEQYKAHSLVKKYFENSVERQHSDGGREYVNALVDEHTLTTSETSQHNPFSETPQHHPVPERVIRTLIKPVRVVHEEAGMSDKYRKFAVEHAFFVKNCVVYS